MSPFYRKKGDDGLTSLIGTGRFPKFSLRLETIGTIDEASSALGLVRSHSNNEETREQIIHIQRDLHHVMSEIATLPDQPKRNPMINQNDIDWIESQIEYISKKVQVPHDFIISGDTPCGAFFDLARTVVRRAERRVVELAHSGELQNPDLQCYLNRLSSYCYIAELWELQSQFHQSITTTKRSI